jgi:orotidine-5'-phosphate decarboxylase
MELCLVDFIVVGRPIYNALDPIKVIEAILKELKA